jgi:hypothetical protein
MMETAQDEMTVVERACVAEVDAALRAGAFVPELQVHMFLVLQP